MRRVTQKEVNATVWKACDTFSDSWLPIIRYYFYKWRRGGVWPQVMSCLTTTFRQVSGLQADVICIAVDSQRVQSVPFVSKGKGMDGISSLMAANGILPHTSTDCL